MQALPIGLRKLLLVDVTGCTLLSTLPPELDVYQLIARNCRNLRALPEELHAVIVDISGCSQLAAWPSAGIAGLWRLYRGAAGLLAGASSFDGPAIPAARSANYDHLPPGCCLGSWFR